MPKRQCPTLSDGRAEAAITANGSTTSVSATSRSARDERRVHVSLRKKRGAHKPAVTLKPGEVVVGRRLYRSGQSEYLINGRVARLRDMQEIFMGIGLGPDSYAIIEQGRIGQILNSKPMDRRAIIEEAAGITMYKTKRRLSEAKLEASKLNLSRVNDIFVEVEKQLASLKRQASKARRYAELREQMRGLLRMMLASKAEHLDIEAARLQNLSAGNGCRGRAGVASPFTNSKRSKSALNARTYELDAELRQTQNLFGSDGPRSRPRGKSHHIQSRASGAYRSARRESVSWKSNKRSGGDRISYSHCARSRHRSPTLREQTASTRSGICAKSTEHASAAPLSKSSSNTRVEALRQLASRAGGGICTRTGRIAAGRRSGGPSTRWRRRTARGGAFH